MAEYPISPKHNVFKKYRTVNYINSYVFAPPEDLSTNTEIGGIASTVSTPALLATKLAIDVSRITNFSIVGSDIKCKITGSYVIPASAFQFNATPCTYYNDDDNLVIGLEGRVFYAMDIVDSLLRTYKFKNCLTVGIEALRRSNAKDILLDNATSLSANSLDQNTLIKTTYVPRCTAIGTSPSVNDGVFSIVPGHVIYAHPSMATINAGGVEADLASAISGGCIVRYVANFTAPSPITTLTTGTIYNTAIQLNFTPPSSTNAIDYYECYVNGVLKNRITASGQYLTGLTASTSYNITVLAVDVFYNKSVVSNVVGATALNTDYSSLGLVSYWKFEQNLNDAISSNSGVGTSVLFDYGKIGDSSKFNGSSSLITIADNSNLSFNNATNDLPFSISYWIKASNTQFSIINKSGASTREYECQYEGGHVNFRLISGGNVSNRLDQNYTMTINTGNWIHIVHTYNGSGSGGMKTYVNGSLAISTNTVTGTYIKMSNTTNPLIMGGITFAGGYFLNGSLDEPSIHNIELSASQVTNLYNSGFGRTL